MKMNTYETESRVVAKRCRVKWEKGEKGREIYLIAWSMMNYLLDLNGYK